MPKETTFEQVPLQQIEKVIEEEVKKEKPKGTTRGISKKASEQPVRPKNGSNGKG